MVDPVIAPAPSCPVCKKKLDDATGLGAKKPAPAADDFGLCFGCGAMLRFWTRVETFTDREPRTWLDVRLATAKERDELAPEQKAMMIRAQHTIIERGCRGGDRILAISADKTLPHRSAPCVRCGRTMSAPAIAPAELGLEATTECVCICTGCVPHGNEIRFEHGVAVFPTSWAAARRN